MNLFDLSIIYLACGAPFAVYYFIQHRRRSFLGQLCAKTILRFLFWLPAAYQLVRGGKFARRLLAWQPSERQITRARTEQEILALRRKIERLCVAADAAFALREWREVYDRYAGLTLAVRDQENSGTSAEPEIFRVAGREADAIGAACFSRRNQNRLAFHQKRARHDFLEFVAAENVFFDGSQFEALTAKLAALLGDDEARSGLTKIFADSLQSEKNLSVTKLEKDLWKSGTPEPLSVRPISLKLRSLSATVNSSTKD